MVERLNGRLFDRLQAERSPDRRALIAGFATQVASLEAPLAEFLQEAFGGSRLDPAPMLRGFYLTSGTQEGTPIDRLTGLLARSFGIDQRRAPSLRPEQGRSYFLTRLLKEVVFGEAMLVSERPGAASRRVLLRSGAFAAIALVVLAGGLLFWHASRANQAEIDRMAAALAEYQKAAADVPLDPVADADLPRILPMLDLARGLPHGYDSRKSDPPSWLQFGLSQDPKLAAGAQAIYRHALERVFLPRLIWRLESQMHGYIQQPDLLYEATRVYLMLGNLGPLDRSLVRAWMTADWDITYPGPANLPVRNGFAGHLYALLAEPLPTIELDGALIEKARAGLSRVPLANRVYSRIGPSATAQAVPPWRPADPLGPAGVRVFLRSSGKPLDRRHTGLLHRGGFPQGAAAGARRRDKAGRERELGARDALRTLAEQPGGAASPGRCHRALRGRLPQELGRDAGRSQRRAVADRGAGGAGSVRIGLAAIADARPSGLDRPPADLVAAAGSAARRGRGVIGGAGGRATGRTRRTALAAEDAARGAGDGGAGRTARQGNRRALSRACANLSAAVRARRSIRR